MSKRLIIIGNGFDIYHGIKSTYNNFKEYIYNHATGEFIRRIEAYIDTEALWSDFEQALGELDSESLQEDYGDSLVGYGADDWRESYNHDYQWQIEEALKFGSEVSEYLGQWIDSLDIDVKRKLRRKYISKSVHYLSFNYTQTLEDIYEVPRNKITYIHGRLGEVKSLIVGHGNEEKFKKPVVPQFNTEEEWDMYYDNQGHDDVREEEAEEIIKQYYKKTYKNVRSIIKKHQKVFNSFNEIEEVWVLGHSMSDVDIPYFKKVQESVSPNSRWTVSYYQEYQKQSYLDKLSMIGVQEQDIELIVLDDLLRKKYKRQDAWL